MNYIPAEKLKAELNKRIGKYDSMLHEWSMPVVKGKREEAFALLTIIDSLQQEQPEVDLENYLEEYFAGWYIEEEIGLTKPDGWSCIVEDLKDIARHFYELGLNARKEDN